MKLLTNFQIVQYLEIKLFSSDIYTGRLWEVNETRLEDSNWWRNSTIEINGKVYKAYKKKYKDAIKLRPVIDINQPIP